jgi:predicted lipoprotein with Yx(FWY)xxD motif
MAGEAASPVTIQCVGACMNFWTVANPGWALQGTPCTSYTRIIRPDGKQQGAACGKPLYQFPQDTGATATNTNPDFTQWNCQ